MQALSTLATIISVLSFPLIFIALLYPHLANARGKWYAVGLYGGVSVGMMVIAVVTAPEPHLPDQEWGSVDWLVVALGGGFLLAYIARKYSSLKKKALARRTMGSKNKDGHLRQHKKGKMNRRS